MYPLLLSTYNGSGEPERPLFQSTDEFYENSEIFMLSGRDIGESVIKNGDFEGLGLTEALARIGGANYGNGFQVFIKYINTVRAMVCTSE